MHEWKPSKAMSMPLERRVQTDEGYRWYTYDELEKREGLDVMRDGLNTSTDSNAKQFYRNEISRLEANITRMLPQMPMKIDRVTASGNK